jgi:hypothetical protein
MRCRALAALLFAAALAGCTTTPVLPPVTPPAAPPPACVAKDASLVAFADIHAALIGKCVRTRGLAVRSLFYENGASFARSQGPSDPSTALALLWQTEEPAPLKSHPQFVELLGRVVACSKEAHCALNAALALSVNDIRIIPTAMD